MGTKEKNRLTLKSKLFRNVLMIDSKVFGLAWGVIIALVIFISTNWLVIKGGNAVGPHLALLSQYFIGYRVTLLGSFIGSAYGFAIGTIFGMLVGVIYNRIVLLRNLD